MRDQNYKIFNQFLGKIIAIVNEIILIIFIISSSVHT